MSKKVKLTVEQVKMLQQHKDKKVRITDEQYKRLKEYIESELPNLTENDEYRPTPKFLKPAEQLKRNFNKYGKNIKGFKAESEEDFIGHPIGGTGGDEYNPQTPEENEQTFNSLNEGLGIELIEFVQNLLQTLKDILTDPSQAGLSNFWVKMGVTRGELFSLLFDAGIIAYVGHKINIKRKGLAKKVKRLYHDLMDREPKNTLKKDAKNPLEKEGIVSLGNDIEVIDELGGYPAGAENDPNAPWNDNRKYTSPKEPKENKYTVVYLNNEMAILKDNNGTLYQFYYHDIDKNDFAEYAEREETYLGRGEEGGAELDYSDFDIDSDVISRFVNSENIPVVTGLDKMGTYDIELNLINREMASDIISIWKDDQKLRDILIPYIRYGENEEATPIIETKISPNFTKLKDKNGKIRKLKKTDGEYRASTSNKKCDNCMFFNGKNGCKILRGVIDKEMVCNYYEKKPETNETTVAGAAADGGSSGPYVTPRVWAKSKKDWRNAKEPMYPSGQIIQRENKVIKLTKDQYKLLKENFDKKAWPEGEFVEFDDCVKFNNNKEAQNGKCSVGAVDNVVKTKKKLESVTEDSERPSGMGSNQNEVKIFYQLNSNDLSFLPASKEYWDINTNNTLWNKYIGPTATHNACSDSSNKEFFFILYRDKLYLYRIKDKALYDRLYKKVSPEDVDSNFIADMNEIIEKTLEKIGTK